MTHRRTLSVSAKGNGCGVVLMDLPSGGRLQLTVVPKAWVEPGALVELDLDEVATAGSVETAVRITVCEAGYLRLCSADFQLLNTVCDVLTGLTFQDVPSDDEDADDARVQPVAMFASSDKHLTTPACAPAPELGSAMWRLVGSEDAFIDLVKGSLGSMRDPLLASLLMQVPEMRAFIRRALIVETERVLKRRRPNFREARAVLPAVRGRLLTDSLVARKARRTLDIGCEFTELDHSQPWQVFLKCAVRVAGQEESYDGGDADLVDRAKRLDRSLHDVTQLTAQQVLRLPRGIQLDRKNKLLGDAIFLAEALLKALDPAGADETGFTSRGLAVGLRFSTALMFERLLEGVELGGGHLVRNNSAGGLKIRLRGNGQAKAPDLRLVHRNTTVELFDAKYKPYRGFADMPMGDQYQQFAYAAVSKRPTTFVYISVNGTGQSESDFAQSADKPLLAVTAVPFPEPGEHPNRWRSRTGELMTRLRADAIE